MIDLDAVRFLSVRQPWADAILTPDGKGVENRSGGFPKWYRGLLLIHAGLGWSTRGALDYRVRALGPPPDRRTRGAILGAVEVLDIHLEHGGCCQPWGESEYQGADGNVQRVVTHLVLARPRRFARPVPCPGGLGLRRPPRDVLTEVVAQLEESTDA